MSSSKWKKSNVSDYAPNVPEDHVTSQVCKSATHFFLTRYINPITDAFTSKYDRVFTVGHVGIRTSEQNNFCKTGPGDFRFFWEVRRTYWHRVEKIRIIVRKW